MTEIGLEPEKRLALCLLVDFEDEEDMAAVRILEKVLEYEELTKEEVSTLLLYVRNLVAARRWGEKKWGRDRLETADGTEGG